MKKHFSHFDWLLLGAVLVLLALGLFMMASVAPDLLGQQGLNVLLGLALFFVFAQIDYRLFGGFVFFIFLGIVAFLLLPFVFGTITRGAVRWVRVASLAVQPSELIKPFLVLFFAWFFSRSKVTLRHLAMGGLLLALPVFLIFWQPDLGSSLVVIFSWLGIVLGAGISWQFLLFGGVLFALGFPVAWRLLEDYQKERLTSFLNPLSDPLGTGYHLIQATVAVGSGRWWGRGFGQGTQSHLRFLPERQTDFIFASLAEELGFWGSFLLLLIFFFLLWRVLVVAGKTKDGFGYLICLGVFSLIFFQTFVNIGMNVGLLPITGVTLPLVSYGGSSLVATLVSLGLVESVARWGGRRRVIEIN